MNIYNIVYSGKYLNALEWFFTDDRGPVRKNGVSHTYWSMPASEGAADLLWASNGWQNISPYL